MRDSRSADYQHGAKGNRARITKASGKSDVTPDINPNPSIADLKNADPEHQSGTASDYRGSTSGRARGRGKRLDQADG